MRAWLELDRRSGARAGAVIRRRAVVVRPGVRVRIRGVVTDPRGRPIGRAILAAVRRERHGTWRAITGVRTRRNGRFTAFARIGPSQDLRFVYYATGTSATRHPQPDPPGHGPPLTARPPASAAATPWRHERRALRGSGRGRRC